jgi:hypothetical protein
MKPKMLNLTQSNNQKSAIEVALATVQTLANRIADPDFCAYAILESGIEGGARAHAKMAESDDMLYALEWAENHAKALAFAHLCGNVWVRLWVSQNEGGEPQTLQTAITRVLNNTRTQVLNNQFSCSSSSAFSNATDAAKRTAACDFIGRAEGALSIYVMAENAIKELRQVAKNTTYPAVYEAATKALKLVGGL